MGFVINYDRFPEGLEESVRQDYISGIERMISNFYSENKANVITNLRVLSYIYNALAKSRPVLGREDVWAYDMIRAYRTLGQISKEIIKGLGLGDLNELEKLVAESEKLRRIMKEHKIDDLDKFKKVLKIYMGQAPNLGDYKRGCEKLREFL